MVDDPQQMNEQEEDPQCLYISKMAHLHLADWIYEFIKFEYSHAKKM